MNKKKLGVTLGSLALVGAIGFGATLAYLSDTAGTLTNTFVVGDNISIELDEAKYNETGRTNEGNEYTDILPGVAFEKDPTVTVNTPTTESYVFMAMRESEQVKPTDFNKKWVLVDEVGSVKVYRYNKPVNNEMLNGEEDIDKDRKGIQLPALFNHAKLDENYDLDNETIIEDILVRAAAIQTGGLTEDQAYAQLRDFLVSVE
ncbi:SipW-dependent-type signal peptide-containing protein [Longibaculum muris]|uniref:SipW-dependent-type signal peptide-containing protein n=1 Tax=Longibaculum muris TaxID=1796628 RepID=UPI0022E62EDF|nr:SipW-dependent-type signal peptide-containing protein [Longibaculum muris]